MSNILETLALNKKVAHEWLTKLNTEYAKESTRIFFRSVFLDPVDQHIAQFTDLIRASDRLSIAYTGASNIISDINSLGNTITHALTFESKFAILYQLLDRKIQKQEEFIACVNAYNDIVLLFLNLKKHEWFKSLNLQTISVIAPSPQTLIGNKSIPKNQLYSAGGAFSFQNETHLRLDFSLMVDQHGKMQMDTMHSLNPKETKTLSRPLQYYKFFISDKEDRGQIISAVLKTVKAGYSYKIVIHRNKQTFLLIST